jgi:hypothetical protein
VGIEQSEIGKRSEQAQPVFLDDYDTENGGIDRKCQKVKSKGICSTELDQDFVDDRARISKRLTPVQID